MEKARLPHEHDDAVGIGYMKEKLEDAPHFDAVAEVFRQLGDMNRVRLFWVLCHREACVIDLSALLALSSPAVSYHLRPLHDNGLVTSRRAGKEVYYRAADTEKVRLLHRMIEEVMEIVCPKHMALGTTPASTAAVVEKIHDELVEDPAKHCTIEELAHRYHINPTTLKESFREMYGSSLAAHRKKHRMEKAAELLRETDDSVSAVAAAVGYESQSKFGVAFREEYGMTPGEYRRRGQMPDDR